MNQTGAQGWLPRLTPAYSRVLEELANRARYRTCGVAEFYLDGRKQRDPDRVNVVIRIDVDYGLHLAAPLARCLKHHEIHASHFFLTRPARYYRIWGSGIPALVHKTGQEIGLHYDHYYEQLAHEIDGLAELREDVRRLSEETRTPVRGMVYHGHAAMSALGHSNWELCRHLRPEELGLEYHDGIQSCYIRPGLATWQPDCDVNISDFLGIPNTWGWNAHPSYPLELLKLAKPGQLVHLAFHTHNAFRFWRRWTDFYGERMPPKPTMIGQRWNGFLIRTRAGEKLRKARATSQRNLASVKAPFKAKPVLIEKKPKRGSNMPNIIIFGASKGGERTLHHFRKYEKGVNVLFFVDNDPNKHGTELMNLPVKGPDAIPETDFDHIFIGSSYGKEISEQLMEMGIDPAKIEFVSNEILRDSGPSIGCIVLMALGGFGLLYLLYHLIF